MRRALLTFVALSGLTSGALAADLGTTVSSPAVTAEPTHWAGAYIGANAGGALSGTYTEDPNFPPGNVIGYAGPFVGGQIGYNFALSDNAVFGIQADLDWANVNGSVSPDPETPDSFKFDWTGSATGRLGLVSGSFLPYVLGGVAFAHGSESFNDNNLFASHTSATQVGWTAGVGGEAMVTDQLSAFIEARYTNYGSANYTGSASGLKSGYGNFNATAAEWSIRAGLNWHLN